MPRFAANLSFLYGEQAFVDRFAAAARDGFEAVEFAFAYEHDRHDLAQRLSDLGHLLRHPVGDDVVVDVGARGDLDDLDAAGVPSALGHDPHARPPLLLRLEVLIVVGVPIALDEAEAKGWLTRDLQWAQPTARGFDFLSDLQALFLPG